jgi:hypothetical protein
MNRLIVLASGLSLDRASRSACGPLRRSTPAAPVGTGRSTRRPACSPAACLLKILYSFGLATIRQESSAMNAEVPSS